MIEGIEKRMDCKFNRSELQALRNFADPLFKSVVICGDELSASFHRKKEVRMNQNWAVGFSILELSKYIMQHLYYKCIRPALNNQCSVLMSDTDSFLILAAGSSSEEIVKTLAPIMDFSNYPETHPLHDKSRKNQLGYIKNETSGSEIIEFVGLKAKTYAFNTTNEFHSRAKGVKKIYKKKIPFAKYLACIKEVRQETITQVSIQAKKHKNLILSSDRVAFNSFDDKRYLMCPIHSVPYGSALIDIMKKEARGCYFCSRPNLLL